MFFMRYRYPIVFQTESSKRTVYLHTKFQVLTQCFLTRFPILSESAKIFLHINC